MSKTFLFILILSAIQLTGYGQTNWSTYTSKEGHYSVSLPGKPTENVQYDSSSGTILAIHLCMLESGEDGVFISSWTDLSKTAANEKSVKQMLEDSRDGTVGAIGGTELKTTALVLTGDPYIEFTFKGANGAFIAQDRIYFINGIQYSLISMFSAAAYKKADSDKFVKSFKHL